jgi:hypothetical protein
VELVACSADPLGRGVARQVGRVADPDRHSPAPHAPPSRAAAPVRACVKSYHSSALQCSWQPLYFLQPKFLSCCGEHYRQYVKCRRFYNLQQLESGGGAATKKCARPVIKKINCETQGLILPEVESLLRLLYTNCKW